MTNQGGSVQCPHHRRSLGGTLDAGEKDRVRIATVRPGENRALLDATDLAMLLDGIDLARVKRPFLWSPPPMSP